MSEQGMAHFGLQEVDGNRIYGIQFCSAGTSSKGTNYRAIRPMIEIPLNKVTLGATGEGTSSSPYSLTAK